MSRRRPGHPVRRGFSNQSHAAHGVLDRPIKSGDDSGEYGVLRPHSNNISNALAIFHRMAWLALEKCALALWRRCDYSPAQRDLSDPGRNNDKTHLYSPHHQLHPQSRRRAQRPPDVGPGPAALRPRQEIHPRNRRADVGRVRQGRRRQGGSLELYAEAARGAGEGQGQGQGGRPVELLPARRRDRPGPEESRLRLYRRPSSARARWPRRP